MAARKFPQSDGHVSFVARLFGDKFEVTAIGPAWAIAAIVLCLVVAAVVFVYLHPGH